MFDHKKRTLFGVTFSFLIGLVAFLGILYIANVLLQTLQLSIYQQIVLFFNENAFNLIIISFLFYIGDAILLLSFPLNIPAPIFKTVASLMLVSFVYLALNALDLLIGLNLMGALNKFSAVVYMIVAIITLLSGYVSVFANEGKPLAKQPEEEKTKEENQKKVEEKLRKIDMISWTEIKAEFRQAFYNIGEAFKRLTAHKDGNKDKSEEGDKQEIKKKKKK